jgi:hypothetical protein
MAIVDIRPPRQTLNDDKSRGSAKVMQVTGEQPTSKDNMPDRSLTSE